MIIDLSTLLTTLNTSGLQTKDPPTYQVIKGLIDALNGKNFASLNSGDINLYQGTNSFEKIVDLDSGQIHFPQIQNPSNDPNTLDDYSQGIFTPADVSGAGLVFFNPNGVYVKIGRVVFFGLYLTYPFTASALTATIGGLPYIAGPEINTLQLCDVQGLTAVFFADVLSNSKTLIIAQEAAGALTNANLSGLSVIINGFYFAAN